MLVVQFMFSGVVAAAPGDYKWAFATTILQTVLVALVGILSGLGVLRNTRKGLILMVIFYVYHLIDQIVGLVIYIQSEVYLGSVVRSFSFGIAFSLGILVYLVSVPTVRKTLVPVLRTALHTVRTLLSPTSIPRISRIGRLS